MRLNSNYIKRRLKGHKVFSYNTVNSTKTVAKKLAETGFDEGTIVCATSQTAGKGRLGRSFLSQKGGVYFSVILRPMGRFDNALFITVAAAVAAARAIENASKKPCEIKWVNDIYQNGKKVCGILAEAGFGEWVGHDYVVLGVGINLFEPKDGFPSNLPLAGSVFDKKSGILFKNKAKQDAIVNFINEFFDFYYYLDQRSYMNEYIEKSFLTGKEITFTRDEQTYRGVVQRIDNNACLVVRVDNRDEILSFGEIQIVGMEQLPI